MLAVTGALMSGPEVAECHEHVKRLVKDGLTNIVVDFAKVKWFGSSMLGVMTASLTTVRNSGGDIRLGSRRAGAELRRPAVFRDGHGLALATRHGAHRLRRVADVDAHFHEFIAHGPVGEPVIEAFERSETDLWL